MNEKRKNLKEVLPEADKNGLSEPLESLKAEILVAPTFAFLEKFDVFTKKKTRFLATGETLFEPGEDPYFYIVASGALKIFRINPTGEKKEVGKAYAGSFLGEGALSGRFTKDVEAVAYISASVVALTKEDFDLLESQSPETLMRFYRHVSDLTSLRLSESNKERALLYETSEKIHSYKEHGERGLLDAISLLKKALSLDYVIAVEQHPAVPGLLVYKYNTKFPSVWPVNQKVGSEFGIHDSGLAGEKKREILGAGANDLTYLLPLKSAFDLRGFLVLGKKNGSAEFSDYEIRIAEHLAPLFASMVENNQRLAETKAKAMLAGT